jgi:farnesyl-diphosphate farnesyltransferase
LRPALLVAPLLQVCNALHHLPHCIKYMQGLRDRDVFRFCAIPQIMAIGTLALCYNNGAVFEGEQGGGYPVLC